LAARAIASFFACVARPLVFSSSNRCLHARSIQLRALEGLNVAINVMAL
jgi:hypothetical protein